MDDNCCKRNGRSGGKMVSGVILLGIGLLFLLQNLDIIDLSESWPLFLIVVGLALLIGSTRRDDKTGSSQSAQE